MAENNDVDLYKELEDELAKSGEEETPVAGDQKPKVDDDTTKKDDIKDENAELSEEEISKLSPRAQKRIRELADKVKELASKEIEEKPKEEPGDPDNSKPHEFKDVKEFLNAVQDNDSRKLLETFYGVIKKETSTTLAPIEAKNNETKFETTFSQYEKIEGMADYKEELKKTFLRDPSQDLGSLIAKTVTDLTLNKIKKSEDKPSEPNRGGKVNLDDLDLAGLYDALDKTKE